MLKYRIFFTFLDGKLYDAYKLEIIAEDIYFNSIKEATEGLISMNNLRKDLTFVILPVIVWE